MKIRDSLKNKAFSPISTIPTVKKRSNVCLKIVPISTLFTPQFNPIWTPYSVFHLGN